MQRKNFDVEPLVAPICGSAAFWSLTFLRSHSANFLPDSIIEAIDYVRSESLTDIAMGRLGSQATEHSYSEATPEQIAELNTFLAKALQQLGAADNS